jgi:hypothetical protein
MQDILERWAAATANKEKLTKDDAVFIFNQAEKLLNDSVETGTIIVDRTNTLLTIIAGVVIGLTGYTIDQVDKKGQFTDLIITTTIGLTYFLLLAFFIIKNLQPHPYKVSGSLPKNLFSDPFFRNVITDDKRIIHFYVSEIENYQFRIEENNKKNSYRWKLYRKTLWAIILSPAVLIVAYFITRAIRSLCG